MSNSCEYRTSQGSIYNDQYYSLYCNTYKGYQRQHQIGHGSFCPFCSVVDDVCLNTYISAVRWMGLIMYPGV